MKYLFFIVMLIVSFNQIEAQDYDFGDVSKEELDQLYKHLEANSTLKIEIYGHTDSIGLEARNQELSEQRAKAVLDYLIEKGLNATRIKSFGFGNTQPISDNDTEEGRQLNRRVAFKLIEN